MANETATTQYKINNDIRGQHTTFKASDEDKCLRIHNVNLLVTVSRKVIPYSLNDKIY